MILTEVHLLAGKLVLVVAIHSLGGSRAFGSPPGKGQEPLTITTVGAGDNHQPPLNDPRCSKPSRNPAAKYKHQVPLDAITQAMHLDSLLISQRR